MSTAILPGQRSWDDAYIRARAMVSNLTNEEKNSILIGQGLSVLDLLFPKNGCAGTSNGNARLGFSGLCLHDGPAGVRGTDLVSAYPSGIHVGASWNRDLARKVGRHMGAEFKRKGGQYVSYNDAQTKLTKTSPSCSGTSGGCPGPYCQRRPKL